MSDSLLNALEKHLEKDYTSFHTPGHKGKGKLTQLARLLDRYGLKTDLTELPGLDNLHCPKGPIMEGEKQAARLVGAKSSFFLVNGATSGILGGILAAGRSGDQLLLPRNCHRSFWSAMVLGDLRPVFVMPKVYSPLQLVLPPTFQEYLTAYTKSRADGKGKTPKLLAGINPTYEGFATNELEQVIAWAGRQQILTLIDEAHGSLFPLHDKLPLSAIQLEGDIIIHGTHKTLGSLTQTGLLHLGTDRLDAHIIRQAIQTVQTTSPSYLLMASLVEVTTGNQAKEQVDDLLQLAEVARKQIWRIKGIKLVDGEILEQHPNLQVDLTRLIISPLELGLTGIQLAEILREKYKIQVEMAQWGYVILLLGLGTIALDTARLLEALTHISQSYGAGGRVTEEFRQSLEKNRKLEYYLKSLAEKNGSQLVVSPRESFYGEAKEVQAADAKGKVAGELVCPYPPGIPLLYPGEVITAEAVELLHSLNGYQTIKVLKS